MAHAGPFKNRFRDHPTLGFIDWVLRGIGQVVSRTIRFPAP